MHRRRPRSALTAALIASAAFAVGACGGGDGDANTKENGGPPTPAEAYSEIVAEVAEQGSTPELALRAFALAFGPIPGAEPPETAEGPPLPSGTGAIQLVMPHWDELSVAQRDAIEERLIPAGLRAEEEQAGLPDGDVSGVGSRPGGATGRLVAHDPGATRLAQTYEADLDFQLQARARAIGAIFARRMGVSRPPSDHFVGPAANAAAREEAGTYAASMSVHVRETSGTRGTFELQEPRRGGGPQDACLTVINPRLKRVSPAFVESILAHETFHCVANQIHGPRWNDQRRHWVTEGLAAWAGEVWTTEQGKAGTRFSEPGEWWDGYFAVGYEKRALFARTYDAIGFWTQLHAISPGAPFWQRLPGILRLSVSDQPLDALNAALGLSGASRRTEFLARWAPQMARQPEFGEEWDLADFATIFKVPADRRLEPEGIDLGAALNGPGDSERVSVDALNPELLRISMPDTDEIDAVEMTVYGYGAMRWEASPNENAVIPGRASRTIHLSEEEDEDEEEEEEARCPPSDEEAAAEEPEPSGEEPAPELSTRRGEVLIVALTGLSNPGIVFSAARSQPASDEEDEEETEQRQEECEEEEGVERETVGPGNPPPGGCDITPWRRVGRRGDPYDGRRDLLCQTFDGEVLATCRFNVSDLESLRRCLRRFR